MKTISKNTKLSLEKFQIAKLHNLNTIMGGAKKDENESARFTTTDTWTTLTYGG